MSEIAVDSNTAHMILVVILTRESVSIDVLRHIYFQNVHCLEALKLSALSGSTMSLSVSFSRSTVSLLRPSAAFAI